MDIPGFDWGSFYGAIIGAIIAALAVIVVYKIGRWDDKVEEKRIKNDLRLRILKSTLLLSIVIA